MNPCSVIVAVTLILAGCAAPHRAQNTAPVAVVAPSTWRQVDADIVNASQVATGKVQIYAQGSMDHWRMLVYERTDEDFIPWFSSYWTQEWLSMKVSWYAISAGKQGQSSSKLALYLQEQYHDRVLAPVAVEIDPDSIKQQATQFYIQLMGQQLPTIAQRYGVSTDQFEQRLNEIPAIKVAPYNASLSQVIHAQPLVTFPAYVALINQLRAVEANSPDTGISAVATQTSEKLEAQFASRSAAGAAAAVAGRVVGAVISIGVAGVRAIAHQSERPEMEAQTRKSLGAAFDQAWLNLISDPDTGVMAGVYYLSGQIERSLVQPVVKPIEKPPLEEMVW